MYKQCFPASNYLTLIAIQNQTYQQTVYHSRKGGGNKIARSAFFVTCLEENIVSLSDFNFFTATLRNDGILSENAFWQLSGASFQ